MKYVDEFRNARLVKRLAQKIREIAPSGNINIMEVCGTHTMSFFRFSLNKLLPPNLRLIAGPGCPVCVSSQGYIDSAIKLTHDKDLIIATFGDMLRIPGSRSTLEKERAKGAGVRVVYSALDSLKIARANPEKKVVFLAVGFETTIPTIGLSIITAKKEKLSNISFFSALKLIPPAMEYLLHDKKLNLSGFLCPGHVSSIIGVKPYEFIPRKHRIPCCIAGFEPLDILEGIYIIIKQIVEHRAQVANQYMRVVKKEGNIQAKRIISRVFKVSPASWRGLGMIADSGLQIKDQYARFDTQKVFSLADKEVFAQGRQNKCRCGEVLKGLIYPLDCPLFAKVCNPDNPIGPCMVSSEGACNAYYKYH